MIVATEPLTLTELLLFAEGDVSRVRPGVGTVGPAVTLTDVGERLLAQFIEGSPFVAGDGHVTWDGNANEQLGEMVKRAIIAALDNA